MEPKSAQLNQATAPLLEAVNRLRSIFSHLCVRGIHNINQEQLKQLREAVDFFSEAGASHFAEHLQQFLSLQPSQPAVASQCFLQLQSRVLLFERQFSRDQGLEQLAQWAINEQG